MRCSAHVGIMRPVDRLLLYSLLAIAASLAYPRTAAASSPTARLAIGAWHAVQPGDTPASALKAAAEGDFKRFDPAHMTAIPTNGLGSWVVLYPTTPELPHQPVLSILNPPGGDITLYGPRGPVNTGSINRINAELPAHGRVAFALPRDIPAAAPILLRFQAARTLDTTSAFKLESRRQFRQDDTRWLVLASASLAVMLSMSLVALCFASMLREATFAWYAAYVSAFAGLQAMQTGFLVQTLGLTAVAPYALPFMAVMLAVSSVSAVFFVTRFCDLQRHAPWLRNLLMAMVTMLAVVALLHMIDLESVRRLVSNLFYPLLAVCSGLMIVAGAVAMVRGSRYALYFLFGWLPLLLITTLISAQMKGALPGVDWLSEASLGFGALQAIVLAIGLADRTLYLRREHHRARELADKDPLTGILNRRGWFEIATNLMGNAGTHSALFMDLDHFKSINDRLGHRSGDHALEIVAQNLATELRPQDPLCRFGGEEFVALLRDTDRDAALQVAQRLCRRLHRMEIPLSRKGGILTISIGVATRRPGENLASLIDRADAAMYAAKSQGRNRVVHDAQLARPSRRAEQAMEDAV